MYNHYQISASTIEPVLMQSEQIREACVVGIFTNEIIDLPAAAIVREKGSTIPEKYIYGLIESTHSFIDNYVCLHQQHFY